MPVLGLSILEVGNLVLVEMVEVWYFITRIEHVMLLRILLLEYLLFLLRVPIVVLQVAHRRWIRCALQQFSHSSLLLCRVERIDGKGLVQCLGNLASMEIPIPMVVALQALQVRMGFCKMERLDTRLCLHSRLWPFLWLLIGCFWDWVGVKHIL
jgi:hypothetical protein